MQSGLYYTIPVKKKLKVGEQYYWTICATEDLPYDWRLMYSADKTGMASENTFVTSEGQQTFGEEQQTVSQYCYYTHKDKVIIIATCWCGSILIYLIILEIIQKYLGNRLLTMKKRRKIMTYKKPELLIPASSLEVLKTAVMFGADAVYIGGEAFGLRAKAKNFSSEEMAEGVAFAHAHGVKVYVTANILAHNYDLDGARKYLLSCGI